MQKVLAAQGKYRQASDVMSATHEVMSLGQALGTSHEELRPQQRADIENRAHQLSGLVGAQTVDKHLAHGRQSAMDRRDARIAALGNPYSDYSRDMGRAAVDTGFLPDQ